MKRLFKRSVLALVMLLQFSGAAYGAKNYGRISFEDYYSSDSNSIYKRHFFTTRLRYDVNKFNTSQTLSFHIDGSIKKKLDGEEYQSSVSDERLNILNLAYESPTKKLYFSAGRLYPEELYLERVDGINFAYKKNGFGVGLFGGTKPDPYTEKVNSDHTSKGAYLFYRSKELTANWAAIHNGYKGETDRQYMYGHLSYYPVGKFRFYGSTTVDFDKESGSTELTNAILEFTVRPDFKKSFTVGYSQFQAFQLFKSMEVKVDRGRHQTYYVRGNYQLFKTYSLYGKYSLKKDHYENVDIEAEDSNQYLLGLRNSKLFGSDMSLDVHSVVYVRDRSEYKTYHIELSEYFTNNLQLTLNGSFSKTEYKTLTDEDRIKTFGATAYYKINKKWAVTLFGEMMKREESTTNTLVSRLTYKF